MNRFESNLLVWKATVSDPTARDDSPWQFHVLAYDISDAAQVAQRQADIVNIGNGQSTDKATPGGPEGGAIVTEIVLVGAYGIFAADNVTLAA